MVHVCALNPRNAPVSDLFWVSLMYFKQGEVPPTMRSRTHAHAPDISVLASGVGYTDARDGGAYVR